MVSWNTEERILSTVNPSRELRFGKAQVACGGAEEENFLTSGSYNRSQKGKDFSKPWTKSENIIVST